MRPNQLGQPSSRNFLLQPTLSNQPIYANKWRNLVPKKWGYEAKKPKNEEVKVSKN
jgi:hypothetical protein